MPIIPFARTYTAKRFSVTNPAGEFLASGTLDGFVDFAMPRPGGSTYPLTTTEARSIATALLSAVDDVDAHCLRDLDAYLMLAEPTAPKRA